MTKKFFLLVFCCSFFSVYSQQNSKAENPKNGDYKIEVILKNFEDSALYMAYYFGKGQYYRDTAKAVKKGKFIFESDKDTLEHGMYSIISGNTKLFDFIVDAQKIRFQADTAQISSSMEVFGSEENKIFFDYLSFLSVKQKEAAALDRKRKSASKKEREKIKQQMLDLDKEVKAFIDQLHQEHAGKLSSNFIKAISVPQVPKPPKKEDGSIDSSFQFRYYKNHFLDDIDFSDERLLRTSAYHEKIMTYMDKLTPQIPDSIIKSIDQILGRAAKNKTLFTYTINNLMAKYERSQQMGMDAVFVHLAKNYYLTEKWSGIISKEQLEKIEERATALNPLLIGKKAPNIVVKDTAQKKFLQLYDVKSPFTVVYIWSPECGHCKVATPKLKKIYDEYKNKGLEVFAVNNDFENEEWIKFINKHKLDWINGSDGGDFKSNFRFNYDVYSTPQTYLLDKDKKILSKKMSVESLRNILDHFMRKEYNNQ